jgi:hypothetical protein
MRRISTSAAPFFYAPQYQPCQHSPHARVFRSKSRSALARAREALRKLPSEIARVITSRWE